MQVFEPPQHWKSSEILISERHCSHHMQKVVDTEYLSPFDKKCKGTEEQAALLHRVARALRERLLNLMAIVSTTAIGDNKNRKNAELKSCRAQCELTQTCKDSPESIAHPRYDLSESGMLAYHIT